MSRNSSSSAPPTDTSTDNTNDGIRPEQAQHTQATFWDALKSLSLRDFKTIHRIPCAREAFLAGIGAGFAFGGVKLVMKGTISSAANWAVGTFCGTSMVVYEACHIRRYKERMGMQRAVEVMDRQARRKGKDAPPPPLAQPEVIKLDEELVVLPVGPKADNPPTVKEAALAVAVRPGVPGAKMSSGDGGEEKPKKSWYRFW